MGHPNPMDLINTFEKKVVSNQAQHIIDEWIDFLKRGDNCPRLSQVTGVIEGVIKALTDKRQAPWFVYIGARVTSSDTIEIFERQSSTSWRKGTLLSTRHKEPVGVADNTILRIKVNLRTDADFRGPGKDQVAFQYMADHIDGLLEALTDADTEQVAGHWILTPLIISRLCRESGFYPTRARSYVADEESIFETSLWDKHSYIHLTLYAGHLLKAHTEVCARYDLAQLTGI